MKKLFLFLLPLVVVSFACRKKVGKDDSKLIQGQVQFQLHNGVTLEQCFYAFKSAGVQEYDFSNFYYSKTIPNDSMLYYHYMLKSRSYITVFNVFKRTGDSFTRFQNLKFKNLSEGNLKNWDSIVKKEVLIEMPDACDGMRRSGLLTVPKGQETFWIEKLNKLAVVYSADYLYSFVGHF